MKYSILFLSLLISFSLCDWKEDIPMQEYEINHIKKMRENAAECTLFLNKNNAFPLKSPGKILLVGAGARDTTKGGTGSGDVESRYYTTIEEGLEDAGFEIVSKDWLDEFPSFKKAKHKEFVTFIEYWADRYASNAGHISFGAVEPEAEYDLPLDEYEADAAVYVIRRNSGEGEDRQIVKGDIYLTDSEIRDILYLDENYDKFMLVLNVAGVVDLSPVKNVKNILLLSQLGVVTGDILADILLGKVNPSGKLSTTWASVKDYRFIEEFGGIDNTRYVEGVYVGYRFFDSANIRPLYPFGFGGSYTDFKMSVNNVESTEKGKVTMDIEVENVGKYPGKEVVQIYVSPPQTNKDKPYQSLVAFKKTKLLEPEESQTLKLTFKLTDLKRYCDKNAVYILDKGDYIVRYGNSSRNTKVHCYLTLDEDVILEKLKHVGGKPDFQDYSPKVKITDDLGEAQQILINAAAFETKSVDYDSYKVSFNQKLLDFNNSELAKMCMCNFDDGKTPFKTHLVGEAGETVLTLDKIKKKVVLADGPAGLRLVKKYGVDEKGIFRLCEDPMLDRLFDYYPGTKHDTLVNNLERAENLKDEEIHYQYATAIPTATALGQSFNEELLELVGDVVGAEMDIFGVNLWLAPGLNIHRNIQNGRNFEYYSEDPLLSGKLAGAITRGVQKHKNRATTIKHYACNNQENVRFNSNSIVSERALREIYLRGFKVAIDEGKPITLMTSYNLINGIHSSERRDLVVDVLRNEWGYDGLVMSDWYTSYDVKVGIANQEYQNAVPNILGGNNLQMGGGKKDYDYIMEAVKFGVITQGNLLECAGKVYDLIEKLNQD